MNSELPEIIEIHPKGEVKAVVIWLHGLGADGHDFEALAQQWDLSERYGIRFVFPNATVQPVTINNGTRMRAWYDIYQMDFVAGEDEKGIRASEMLIKNLIAHECEKNKLSSESILLAGFSQGGAIALHTGLRFSSPLAGILGLSCYLPIAHTLAAEKNAAQRLTPLRMDHGNQDPVVPLILADRSKDILESQGYNVEFNRYDMQHNLIPEQIQSLYQWVRQLIVKID